MCKRVQWGNLCWVMPWYEDLWFSISYKSSTLYLLHLLITRDICFANGSAAAGLLYAHSRSHHPTLVGMMKHSTLYCWILLHTGVANYTTIVILIFLRRVQAEIFEWTWFGVVTEGWREYMLWVVSFWRMNVYSWKGTIIGSDGRAFDWYLIH